VWVILTGLELIQLAELTPSLVSLHIRRLRNWYECMHTYDFISRLAPDHKDPGFKHRQMSILPPKLQTIKLAGDILFDTSQFVDMVVSDGGKLV
jgi:hypothetical protein